jgi:hypothetical protein
MIFPSEAIWFDVKPIWIGDDGKFRWWSNFGRLFDIDFGGFWYERLFFNNWIIINTRHNVTKKNTRQIIAKIIMEFWRLKND